jgi:hypothetical protein
MTRRKGSSDGTASNEISPTTRGTGRFGFMMVWTIAAGDPSVFGTYTVTAG